MLGYIYLDHNSFNFFRYSVHITSSGIFYLSWNLDWAKCYNRGIWKNWVKEKHLEKEKHLVSLASRLDIFALVKNHFCSSENQTVLSVLIKSETPWKTQGNCIGITIFLHLHWIKRLFIVKFAFNWTTKRIAFCSMWRKEQLQLYQCICK